MHRAIDWVADEASHGKRLDRVITDHLLDIGRAEISEAIKTECIFVNGSIITKCSHKTLKGDHITGSIFLRSKITQEVKPQDLPLNIYYQDEHIVVLHKPRGLVTHPGAGNPDGTLLNGIYFHFPQTHYLPKGGLVQRLDKDTSGLMVVALTMEAYQKLVQMMQVRRIKRQYEALVWGRPPETMLIDAPLGRHARDHRMRAVVVSGKPSITDMRVLAYGAWGSVVECDLKTGRTHQIRVHMKHIGYTICGDELYGMQHPPLPNPQGWRGQALHAKHLAFHHPITEVPLRFDAPFPEGWDDWLKILDIKTQQFV